MNGNYDYDLQLVKKGYELSTDKKTLKNGDLVFDVSIVEISQLQIEITDEQGEPKEGILVYITSISKAKGDMKKLNSNTDKNGEIKLDIYKGQYYVKAVLKEYEFSPAQKLITIEEGQTERIVIKAKRT